MRVVLDTNILIGAPITRGTPPDRLSLGDVRGIPVLTAREALEYLQSRTAPRQP